MFLQINEEKLINLHCFVSLFCESHGKNKTKFRIGTFIGITVLPICKNDFHETGFVFFCRFSAHMYVSYHLLHVKNECCENG